MITLMRGIPGSGKTTLVRNRFTNDLVVSADFAFYGEPQCQYAKYMIEGNYRFDPARLQEAHGQCLRSFIGALAGADAGMVVDNGNTTIEELLPFIRIAEAYTIPVQIVTCQCDVETAVARNIHHVPRHTIERLHGNMGRTLPAWAQRYCI
jgi:hypothetical protein